MFKVKSPILFLVFNRPDTTEQVFKAIAEIKPTKLYIASDGPRKNKNGERAIVDTIRSTIIKNINWECQVNILFREENLGCKMAVSTAIDWFFTNEEEGIILEDDCLPNLSFFKYCDQLLEFYREDDRVSHIAGVNFQFGEKRLENSYYFSSLSHIWGWATWKRSWLKYDVHIRLWPEIKQSGSLENILVDKKFIRFYTEIFDQLYNGKIDTWDYQWTLACWMNSSLTIIPSVNLVKNIGFGQDATHTTILNRYANLPSGELSFPISHPPFMMRDLSADLNILQNEYSSSIFKITISKIFSPIKRTLKKYYEFIK